jgi:hypothetical protein
MGLEYIVQPQIFLGGLTALGPGIQGLTEQYPLLTTYYSWTSTASVNTSSFPIPIAVGSIYDGPGKEASFIVSVGGVIQSPTEYTVDTILRTITFGSVVSAGIEFAATQLATASPSSQNFNFLKSVSAEFTSTAFINNLSATTGTVDSLLVTNLTALSTTVNVIDIRISEVSGFRATGNVDVLGSVNVTNNINLTGNLVASDITSVTLTALNATFTNLTADNLQVTNPVNNLNVVNLTVTNPVNNLNVVNLTATNLSAVNITVNGNVSASGAIIATNTWPNNRQYFVLTADQAFPSNTGFGLMSSTPITIKGNEIYDLTVYILLSSTTTTTTYTLNLSSSNNITVIEGFAGNSGQIPTPVLTYARDLRGAGTGTNINIFPSLSYSTGAGVLVGNSFNMRISADTTTQVLVSGLASGAGRVKANSNWTSIALT